MWPDTDPRAGAEGREPVNKRRAITPGPLTVLTRPELARWLKVSERTVDRIQPPSLPVTDGVRRYLVADVLDWLRERRKEAQPA